MAGPCVFRSPSSFPLTGGNIGLKLAAPGQWLALMLSSNTYFLILVNSLIFGHV